MHCSLHYSHSHCVLSIVSVVMYEHVWTNIRALSIEFEFLGVGFVSLWLGCSLV